MTVLELTDLELTESPICRECGDDLDYQGGWCPANPEDGWCEACCGCRDEVTA